MRGCTFPDQGGADFSLKTSVPHPEKATDPSFNFHAATYDQMLGNRRTTVIWPVPVSCFVYFSFFVNFLTVDSLQLWKSDLQT